MMNKDFSSSPVLNATVSSSARQRRLKTFQSIKQGAVDSTRLLEYHRCLGGPTWHLYSSCIRSPLFAANDGKRNFTQSVPDQHTQIWSFGNSESKKGGSSWFMKDSCCFLGKIVFKNNSADLIKLEPETYSYVLSFVQASKILFPLICFYCFSYCLLQPCHPVCT